MMTEVQYEEHNTCEKDIMIFDFFTINSGHLQKRVDSIAQ